MAEPSQNPPSPEKNPQRPPAESGFPVGPFSLGAAGDRLAGISSLHCADMGRDDICFLITTVSGRDQTSAAFDEVWQWLTNSPHDTLFARGPTDRDLLDLGLSSEQSWELGRRVSNGVVEYFATLRIEGGAWAGITIRASHLENWMQPDRIQFSAIAGPSSIPGALPREERVGRLCRLCGLTDFKSTGNGADLVARSATLEAGEFNLFCGA